MEVTQSSELSGRIKSIFLKDPVPFATRREVNWRAIKIASVALVSVVILGLLLYPEPKPAQTVYYEKTSNGANQPNVAEMGSSDSTLNQLEQARASVGNVPRNLDYISGGSRAGGGSSNGPERNSSMIVTRGGLDLKNQLPSGTRISVRLTENSIVSSESLPIIGMVARDFVSEEGLAIPQGAKVFGDVSFDSGSERAAIAWHSIQMPDGRQRQFSAIGVGSDGQVGVEGKVHSEALKNTIGQTLTRFIGAYAEGSMERGALGGNPGGDQNGWKNAVAQTAKDRAENWAEGMKKEKKWIELRAGHESIAVLREPFTFRDPGGAIR